MLAFLRAVDGHFTDLGERMFGADEQLPQEQEK